MVLPIYPQPRYRYKFASAISPPQTKSAKILWLGVVCLGFTGAGILIGKSYMEWQEKPIATTITTYPIDDLQFPQVTICPPKDSNTALYHDLVKAGNRTLSDEIRKTLKKAAYDMFLKYNMNFIALFQLMSKNKFAFYAIETDK